MAFLCIGTRYVYDYESHVQSKVGSMVNENSAKRSRHLSFKINANLIVTNVWNSTLLNVEVRAAKINFKMSSKHSTQLLLQLLILKV
jgi:uncharacterized membrane protein YiaA